MVGSELTEGERSRAGTLKSLAHARWECKDPVVFIPTSRRTALSGERRKLWGESFHEVARQQEWRLSEGPLLPDPVPRCLAIAPPQAVAAGIGFLKGKRARALARRAHEKERKFVGEPCWARGYAGSTVGFALESVKKSIREQETADKDGRC